MPSSTQAQIQVVGRPVAADSLGLAPGVGAVFAGSEAAVIDEVTSCQYSSDVMGVGDECKLTVANPDGRHTAALKTGDTVKIYLANPAVNGGDPSLKFLGLVVDREAVSDSRQGSRINLSCADLGWHLQNNCAPLWRSLQGVKYSALCDPATPNSLVDEQRNRFGFRGIRFDNDINRRIKQGLSAEKALEQQKIDEVIRRIEVEPGDTIFDKIAEYSRRANLLVNVSVDGYIQCFQPDYLRVPELEIRRAAGAGHNNVIEGRMLESIRTVWTDVECVGEEDTDDNALEDDGVHAGKTRGSISRRDLLPFVHRLTFVEPEMRSNRLAQRAALWKWQRGLFDSFYVEYLVPEHFHVGPVRALWWENDTMVSVLDEEFGLSGNFWCQSVHYETGVTGDVTRVLLRRPGLLSADARGLPLPPRVKSARKSHSNPKPVYV
jgi:hypothetical protein